jgi:hypothetical protein
MTSGDLRLVSFSDPEGDVWGSGLDLGTPALLLGTAGGRRTLIGSEQLELNSGGDVWFLGAEGVELRVSPASEDEEDVESSPAGDQLCRAEGTVIVGSDVREIDCLAVRGRPQAPPVPAASLRVVSAFFGSGQAVALRSWRRRERGHEEDVLAATLFDEPDPTHPTDVADPRLSTTYQPDEIPLRTNLELWVGEGDELFPRRTAAEASGPPATAQADQIRLSASPLRCHFSGEDGAGVYLIAQF